MSASRAAISGVVSARAATGAVSDQEAPTATASAHNDLLMILAAVLRYGLGPSKDQAMAKTKTTTDQAPAQSETNASGAKDAARDSKEDDGKRVEAARARLGAAGRNDPCPCGSGKKYKKCCGGATVN